MKKELSRTIQRPKKDVPRLSKARGGSGLKRSRRVLGEIVTVNMDSDDDFPPVLNSQPPTKLPTKKGVIGMMRNLTLGWEV